VCRPWTWVPLGIGIMHEELWRARFLSAGCQFCAVDAPKPLETILLRLMLT
jgi:hypothetical protein